MTLQELLQLLVLDPTIAAVAVRAGPLFEPVRLDAAGLRKLSVDPAPVESLLARRFIECPVMWEDFSRDRHGYQLERAWMRAYVASGAGTPHVTPEPVWERTITAYGRDDYPVRALEAAESALRADDATEQLHPALAIFASAWAASCRETALSLEIETRLHRLWKAEGDEIGPKGWWSLRFDALVELRQRIYPLVHALIELIPAGSDARSRARSCWDSGMDALHYWEVVAEFPLLAELERAVVPDWDDASAPTDRTDAFFPSLCERQGRIRSLRDIADEIGAPP